jgi:hypothetical protein
VAQGKRDTTRQCTSCGEGARGRQCTLPPLGLEICEGATGGEVEGSLDERRRGKAGSGQRVRCNATGATRDASDAMRHGMGDAASSSRTQQRNRTTPYAATGALEKGEGTAYRIPLVVLAAVARPSKSRTDSGTARAPPDWPHRVASSNRHGHGSLIAPLLTQLPPLAYAAEQRCSHTPIPGR